MDLFGFSGFSCSSDKKVSLISTKYIFLYSYIFSRPQKEMVRRGETIRLRCEAEGDEPIRISWLAKGISLNDTKDPRLVMYFSLSFYYQYWCNDSIYYYCTKYFTKKLIHLKICNNSTPCQHWEWFTITFNIRAYN